MTNNNSIVRFLGKKGVKFFNEEINSFCDMYNIELEKQYDISRAFLDKLLKTIQYEGECIIIYFY